MILRRKLSGLKRTTEALDPLHLTKKLIKYEKHDNEVGKKIPKKEKTYKIKILVKCNGW